MKILGYEIKRTKPPKRERELLLERPSSPQGPYTNMFEGFIARKVRPALYEAMREAVPTIDAGLNLLGILDGIVHVDGNNKGLVRELEDWMFAVPVNDMDIGQVGLQAFVNNFTNETYEQGFSCSQYASVPGRGITKLIVGDSKDFRFRRNKGLEVWHKGRTDNKKRPGDATEKVGDLLKGNIDTETIGSLTANGWVKLNTDNLIYYSIGNENSNPYGVSYLRSMEFVTQILLTIQNSLLITWEKFGAPMYNVEYNIGKGKLPGKEDPESFRKKLADNFRDLIEGKKNGKNGDLVNVVGEGGSVKATVIGGEGQVLELESPARHVLEQIMSRFSIPSWLLGGNWSTTERLAKYQVEILLQEATIRGNNKIIPITRLGEEHLRLKGRTWKRDDFFFYMDQPNLHDIVALAQANMLNAQADYMRSGKGTPSLGAAGNPGEENGKDEKRVKAGFRVQGAGFREKLKQYRESWYQKAIQNHGCNEKSARISRASLDIEEEYVDTLKKKWKETGERALRALGITTEKNKSIKEKDPDINAMRRELQRFIDDINADTRDYQGPVVVFTGMAYSQGLIDAVTEKGLTGAPIGDIITNESTVRELYRNGFKLVKNNTIRLMKEEIIPVMEQLVKDGWNPMDVARKLRQTFGDTGYLWERLARSEMAIAREVAKRDEWKAQGEKELEFKPAPGACIDPCQEKAGIYPIGTSPIAVRDTHPNCKCSNTLVSRREV